MGDTVHTDVFLITGFLGSGKTTLLNRIIRGFPRERRLMILMNEFGEVGIDGVLVEGEDLDVLEISKGSIFCVCVKTDFIKGLYEIATGLRPDVLVIESTGVANPTDLKRDIQLPLFGGRFRFREQFCVVDVSTFSTAYEVFSSVEKQIESSTVFVLNKVDLVEPSQVEAVKDLIRRHHPAPVFFETTYADIPWERFLLGAEAEGTEGLAADVPELGDDDIERMVEEMVADPNREVTAPDRLLSAVCEWKGRTRDDLARAAAFLPEGVVRAKGFVTVDGAPRLFSYVMGRWTLDEATLPPGKEHLRDRVVVIGSPEAVSALPRDEGLLRKAGVLDPAGITRSGSGTGDG